MDLKRNVCFYYPSYILGGAEILFARIANYLADNSDKKVFFIDYSDGISNQLLNNKVIKVSSADKISLEDNTVIISAITLAYNLPEVLNKNIRFLFWNLHPENIWWLAKNAGLKKKLLTKFIKKTIAEKSLISMDSATNFAIKNLVHKNTPIVPIMVNDSKYFIRKKLISKNELNIVWLSRLDDDKIYSLLNLLENLKNYKTEKKIILKIIGDGKAKNLIDIQHYSKYFKIIFEGIIKPPQLYEYLQNNADCLFSMGTSLIEASKIGIPSILSFLFDKPAKENSYVFLYKTKNHLLGSNSNFYVLKEIKLPLQNILDIIQNDYEYISEASRKHFCENFLIDTQINKLILNINSCKLSQIKRQKINMIQNIINFFKNNNKTVRFFRNKLTNNKKILIFISSYSHFENMKQRPEHLFEQFIKDGYIIAWGEKALNSVVEYSPNIYGYPMKDTKQLVFNKKIINKTIMTISTHFTFDNIEKLLIKAANKKIPVIFEHLDDITLISKKKIQNKLYKRFNTICKHDNIIISTTADNLYKQAIEVRGSDKNIVIAKNGVNLEIFQNSKFNPDFEKFISDNKPIVGYYGCIFKEWFDFDTLEYAVKNNPHLNFVIIGPHVKEDVSILNQYNNFLCLDKMNFEELIKYSKHFNAAIIPFLLNDITKGTSPVKMFEYMAQGLPIVTTAMNECKNYKSCLIANNKEEFSALINKALKLKNDENYKLLLQKEASENSWENIYQKIKKAII